MTPLDRVLDALRSHGMEPKLRGKEWTCRCPAHDDHNPSLSFTQPNGKILLKCHAGCTADDIVAAIGLSMRDLFDDTGKVQRREVAAYTYTDEAGKPLFEMVRFEPKDFRPRRPSGELGIEGVRRVLYNLPGVVSVRSDGGTVYVCEGEKDADRLNADAEAGDSCMIATTNPFGAENWREEYTACLKGARVVVVADRDKPGRKHAADIYRSCRAQEIPVVVKEPATGKDLSDHLDAGYSLAQLLDTTDAILRGEATADDDTPAPTLPAPEPYRVKRVDLLLLSEKKFPALVPIVPGWHMDDIALLVSAGGTVKSSLVDYLAVCLATGLPVFGVEPYKPRERYRVSIFHEEEPEDGAGRRWQRVETGLGVKPADYAEFVFVNEFQSGLNLSDPQHLDALRAHCREFKPHHIFIDSIGQASGILKPNEGPHVRQFFAQGPQALRREFGVGCTLLAHVNKSAFSKIPTMEKLGQILHSVEFVNCADSIQFAWSVKGQPDHRQLHFLKPRRCAPQPGIEFRFANGLFDPRFGEQEQPFRFDFVRELPPGGDDGATTTTTSAPSERDLGPDVKRVGDYLDKKRGSYFVKDELTSRCKVSRRTVDNAIAQLPGLDARRREGGKAKEFGFPPDSEENDR